MAKFTSGIWLLIGFEVTEILEHRSTEEASFVGGLQ